MRLNPYRLLSRRNDLKVRPTHVLIKLNVWMRHVISFTQGLVPVSIPSVQEWEHTKFGTHSKHGYDVAPSTITKVIRCVTRSRE